MSEPLHPTAATSSAPTAGAAATLDDRYGRTSGHKRRSRVIAIIAAIAVVVVFGAWVIWAGLDQANHGLDSQDVGYQIVSEHRAAVHSQISVDPGTTARCAVQVLDKSFTIVGWKVITLPKSADRTRNVTTDVNTTTRGVTGLIHDCWVP
ncbi:DUF4307 domain-containing protein [Curtobacterium sp. ISL-83]|uniref:DUF4307 domain-containing protein n=1 Tax=Curtobacterium sp. ISL-83 TaxID=2819145 RepID=UPI0027E077C9|nr:DUF4307 domain-containing protein [Curtobacterium sp. ISL-83]